jgi:hypothetical protein
VLKFAVDENFNNDILRGVLRRDPDIDIVRVQDAGLSRTNDEAILAWCAEEGRVLLTHDAASMVAFAYDRAVQGLPMPGVFEAPFVVPIGLLIEEVLLVAHASIDGEWEGQVRYFPLR